MPDPGPYLSVCALIEYLDWDPQTREPVLGTLTNRVRPVGPRAEFLLFLQFYPGTDPDPEVFVHAPEFGYEHEPLECAIQPKVAGSPRRGQMAFSALAVAAGTYWIEVRIGGLLTRIPQEVEPAGSGWEGFQDQ